MEGRPFSGGLKPESSMDLNTSKITFIPEGEEEPVDFYVLDEATLRGAHYLIVTDQDPDEIGGDEEGEAYILIDRSGEDDEEAVYEFVSDDAEMAAVAGLFRDTLDDLGIDLE